ncbi:hypothetical protein [Pinisolibacter sp.]|uniref:hypothetical protein n=1 Tax=Pinisolibacter sp. TaxID=2172024 RepID=UPI002FDD31D4
MFPLRGLVAVAAVLTLTVVDAEARCVLDPTPCRGCGCKGGPGWRHIASGRCVGFRDLAAKCGDPPSPKLCVFENAPGTGANRDCALAPAVPPPDDEPPR